MASLIINADDLGIAPSIDEGIFEAHREGIVTSTTAFATSPRFEQVVNRAHDAGLALGLHLNLTLGTCACKPEGPTLLTDEQGFFKLTSRQLPRLLGKAHRNRELLADIRNEFSAQFAKACDAGISFTHFDSHQYVHMIPAVFAVAAELAPRFGFSRTRFAAEPMTRFHLGHRPLAVLARRNYIKWAWLRMVARRIDNPLSSPDSFYGVLHSGVFDRSTLLGYLGILRKGSVTELGIHPGYPCAPTQANYPQPFVNGFIASPLRLQELDAVTAPEVRQAVKDHRVQLISYADLGTAGRS